MNDTTAGARQERRALLLSVWGSAGMAALGVLFALLAHSQAILFDGVFSAIGFIMALVTVWVAKLVQRPDDELFHFGYATFEPMVNFVKGALMVIVSLFAAVSAIDAVLQGGRSMAAGVATIYAAIAAAGCFVISALQRSGAKRLASPLLAVDAKGWLIDGLLSSAVGAGFLAAMLITGTRWSGLVPYADPAVVLLLVVLSAPVPIRILGESLNELLMGAPDKALQARVHATLDRVLTNVPCCDRRVRLVKSGRVVYAQIYLLVEKGVEIHDLAELDSLRQEIADGLASAVPEIALDVIFTLDRKWMQGSIQPPGAARRG
jgi:cation diffusion facilitator family transporter